MKIKELQLTISQLKKEQISKSALAKALKFSRQYVSEMFEKNKEVTPDKIPLLEEYFKIKLPGEQVKQQKTSSDEIPKDAEIDELEKECQLFAKTLDLKTGLRLRTKIDRMLSKLAEDDS
jgi:transcriptional regulator with XRE-family HTH domain